MANRKHDAMVQVELSVDVHIPFRKRQFLQQGKRYTVDGQVAGFLLEGKYAEVVNHAV